MKISSIALSLSLFASAFAMEAKTVRKTTENETIGFSVEEGAMVPFKGEQSIVVFNPEAEADAWLQEAVEVNAEDLAEYYNYTGAITMFSPEAIARISCALEGTSSLLCYTGTQLYCISKVALIMAQRALANAEVALDKAEEVEGGLKKVLDRAENVADRYHAVRGEFQKDCERANNMIEGKKPSDRSEDKL